MELKRTRLDGYRSPSREDLSTLAMLPLLHRPLYRKRFSLYYVSSCFLCFSSPFSFSLSLSFFSGDPLIFPPCSIEQLGLVISRTATRMDSRFPWPEHQIFNIVPLCGYRTIEICWLESVIIIAVVVPAWKEQTIFKRIVERYRAWIWRPLSGFCETAI